MSINAQKKIRLAYIAAAGVAFLFLMIRAMSAPQGTQSDPLFATALAVFVTMACVADSAALGRPIAFEVRLPFAVMWPVTMPIYLIRARGWWGVLILLMIVASFVGAAIVFATIEVAKTLLRR